MKKPFLLASCIVISLSAMSQITYLYTMPYSFVYHVHFQNAGYKLVAVDVDNNQILLFNYNNSLYKTINVPPVPDTVNGYNIFYLSESLFDNDPSNFEFVQQYYTQVNFHYTYYTKIYREDGTLIFSRDTLILTGSGSLLGTYITDAPIFNRGNVTYMRFGSQGPSDWISKRTELYKLPGHLTATPTTPENRFADGSENITSPNDLTFSFPNPSSTATKIYYQLPQGTSDGNLIVYDLNGNVVQQFKVSDVFNYITVTTNDLPSGTYTYAIQTANDLIKGKEMVVVH